VKRQRVIIAAVALALLGAIIPIVAMLHFSRVIAIQNEYERLEQITGRMIARAELSLTSANDALQEIKDFKGKPCSREHIMRMREVSFKNRPIEEVGYFENGYLKCTSWGVSDVRVAQTPADFKTASGLDVTISVQPIVIREQRPMMALQRGPYNVLIDPIRFADVIVSPNIKLALATGDGKFIAHLNDPNRTLVEQIIAGADDRGLKDGNLFARSRQRNWVAISIEPESQVLEGIRQQELLLVPFGIVLALLNIAGVSWLSRRRLSPLGELQIAVQNREFIVHYQPVIQLETGRCVGAEALVRWQRPDGTLLRPDLFIPLAETSGLIKPITDQIIALVVKDLGKFLVADRDMHVAINLCAEDVGTTRALNVLAEALQNTGIMPEQIWLEVTERGFIDIKAARTTLLRAHELGYSVAIDDFGTGYSRLSYLHGLPLDALKIDKTFIDTIGLDSATSSVTPHIIDMAKSLNLTMVAEGIETQAQADYLTERGVQYGQGWLFARPMIAHDFIAFFKRMKGTPPAS